MDTIATRTKTKEILDKYGLSAKKKFGQNFLIEPNIVKRIAEVGTDKESICIEVGPGIGSLTQQLLNNSQRVIAYELDSDLIELLHNELNNETLEIIHQDFLEADLSNYYNIDNLYFCANLPYYITSAILMKLIMSGLNFKAITIMVQKEVAQRIKAEPGTSDYGALSAMVAKRFKVKNIMQVASNCFLPAPKVDSSIIQLIPKGEADYDNEKDLYDFIQVCFTQRRKTLKNNLLQLMDKEIADRLIKELGWQESIRAQQLSVEDFELLLKRVKEEDIVLK